MRVFFLLLSMLLIFSCAGHKKYVLTEDALQIVQQFDHVRHAQKIDLMAGTVYQTPAFIFDSGIAGQTVIILGGTHGDEPAGYEAGLRLVRMLEENPPKKGKVILIPMANRKADQIYNRRVPVPQGTDWERGNLNRCYPGKKDGLPMEQLAWQITQLAQKNGVQIFIDMHEAHYLHLNTPKESKRKRGLGQTIIYYPNDASAALVIDLLDELNAGISNPDEKFSSIEKPIKTSAAWWAGKYMHIAAFTFETMRKLPLQKRIGYHLKLVQTVLKDAQIW